MIRGLLVAGVAVLVFACGGEDPAEPVQVVERTVAAPTATPTAEPEPPTPTAEPEPTPTNYEPVRTSFKLGPGESHTLEFYFEENHGFVWGFASDGEVVVEFTNPEGAQFKGYISDCMDGNLRKVEPFWDDGEYSVSFHNSCTPSTEREVVLKYQLFKTEIGQEEPEPTPDPWARTDFRLDPGETRTFTFSVDSAHIFYWELSSHEHVNLELRYPEPYGNRTRTWECTRGFHRELDVFFWEGEYTVTVDNSCEGTEQTLVILSQMLFPPGDR